MVLTLFTFCSYAAAACTMKRGLRPGLYLLHHRVSSISKGGTEHTNALKGKHSETTGTSLEWQIFNGLANVLIITIYIFLNLNYAC